jgi:hypothetical protein
MLMAPKTLPISCAFLAMQAPTQLCRLCKVRECVLSLALPSQLLIQVQHWKLWQLLPAGYHHFEGDGMVHAVRLKGGKASYANRYIHTHRLQQELAAQRPLYTKVRWAAVGVDSASDP